tara:strand:- start:9085 stop:9909 length:825 start_codon:yes stop_codon:yes gene_type:complete
VERKYNSATQPIKATVKYLARNEKSPVFYIGVPQGEQTQEPPSFEKKTVLVHNTRPNLSSFSLEENGFEFKIQELPEMDFLDKEAVIEKYYKVSEDLVADSTGALRVIAFDHNVRDYELASMDSRVDNPVRFVHNDYTEGSAPQRVIDLLGSESERWLRKRYAFINVWRPLRGPILDFPLGFIDSKSLSSADFVDSELRYQDRVGHIYSVVNNPDHRWYYLEQMMPEEILLLKCFDSETKGQARYTGHAAFKHPSFSESHLPRRSIETRTIAFY